MVKIIPQFAITTSLQSLLFFGFFSSYPYKYTYKKFMPFKCQGFLTARKRVGALQRNKRMPGHEKNTLQRSISTVTVGESSKLGLVLESHGDDEDGDGEERGPDDRGEKVDRQVAVREDQPLGLLLLLLLFVEHHVGECFYDSRSGHDKALKVALP